MNENMQCLNKEEWLENISSNYVSKLNSCLEIKLSNILYLFKIYTIIGNDNMDTIH